jgi:hypothetical protein
MKTFQCEQGSAEWNSLRAGKLTGSKLHGIVVKRGTKKKIGFYELMADRLSVPEEGSESPLDLGVRLESFALELFSKEIGKEIDTVGFCVSDDNPDIALSPDGLINGGKEAVEIKCLSSANHLKVHFEQEVPDENWEQVLQYFIVIKELQTLHFVCYDPRITAKPLITLEIHRKDVQEEADALYQYQVDTLVEINELLERLAF